MINVLRFADDALYMVIDALDEAEASFAASYDDWLADGGDPSDHPYYRIAQANSAFGHAVVYATDEDTPPNPYIYDTTQPVRPFRAPKPLAFWAAHLKEQA